MSDPGSATTSPAASKSSIAPVWVNDKDVKECWVCNSSFTFPKRKHHCRLCGHVVCDKCSEARLTAPQVFGTEKLRTCSKCYTDHQNGVPMPTVFPSERGPITVHATIPVAAFQAQNEEGRTHSRSTSSSVTERPTVAQAIIAAPAVAAAVPVAQVIKQDKKASGGGFFNTLYQTARERGASALAPAVTPATTATPAPAFTGEITPAPVPVPALAPAPPVATITPTPIPATAPHITFTQPENELRKRKPTSANDDDGERGNASGGLSVTSLSDQEVKDPAASKLDLPLRLCLVILNKTAAEMNEQYTIYLKTKKQRQENEPLNFHQFMFFSTIRTLPDFLFKKTKLAYYMMREENSSSQFVHLPLFSRYAPVLTPLASKVDVAKVFTALSMGTDGIRFTEFKTYVDNLKRETMLEEETWMDFRTDFGLDKHEQLLCVRTGVADSSGFAPQIGRVGICSNHLIYESVFKKRQKYKWSHVIRIEKNEAGFFRKGDPGMKITVREDVDDDSKDADLTKAKDKGKSEITLLWDLPGFGADIMVERTRTFQYIHDMIIAHKLAQQQQDKQIANALLYETGETIRRMRALENINPAIDPTILSPFRNDTVEEQKTYVNAIRSLVQKNESIRQSKSNWLYKVLPGLQSQDAKDSINDDIDPELRFVYKTTEELNRMAKEEQDPFSLKTFAYNFKLLKHLLEPLFVFIAAIKRLRNWDNPTATILAILFLFWLSYADLLNYLPAMFIAANIGLILAVKRDKDVVKKILIFLAPPNHPIDTDTSSESPPNTTPRSSMSISSADAAALSASIADATQTSPSPRAHAMTPVSSPGGSAGTIGTAPFSGTMPVAAPIANDKDKKGKKKKKEEDVGLVAKIKSYRDAAIKTKDGLENIQNGVGQVNTRLMQLEGLYKWRTPTATNKWLLMLTVGLILFLFVPFRFVFPFIVIDFFTDKFQRDGSSLERILEGVALPEKLPELE